VRRFRRQLGARDRLFFIIGIDAFVEIATWREPEALLREAEFIVASRPGYSLEQVRAALPESMRSEAAKLRRGATKVRVGNATIHLLPETRDRASASEIRAAGARGKKLGAMVPKNVAEYIEKMHLYEAGEADQPEATAASVHHHTTGGH
jgi:nicotinate-nucleotide adenylyltransferase